MIHATPTAPVAVAETAVRDLLAGLAAAWNAGDADAYGAAFTEDCDYVTFNGERQRGRSAVAESHRRLFATHLKGSRMVVESADLRALDPATLIVHAIGNTAMRHQKDFPASRRSLQTLVAVERGGEWRFTAFHNTRVFKITPFRAVLMMLGF